MSTVRKQPPQSEDSGSEDDVKQPIPKIVKLAPKLSATLTATLVPKETEKNWCGNFQRVRKWNVENPVVGVIVQHLTRTFDVHDYKQGRKLSNKEIDAYVKNKDSIVHATKTEYWELWTVTAAGAVGDGGHDTFGLCSIIPWAKKGEPKFQDVKDTTKGNFVISGEAYFFATPEPQVPPATFASNHGFTRGDPETDVAGGLFRTFTDPSLSDPESGPVKYTVTVIWDSHSTLKATSNVIGRNG